MRTYESTHPWLTFSVNLKPLSAETWMMLGESQSKCDHLSRVPLRPDVAEKLSKMYIAKGVLATTAIEGNTLTEEEVNQFLDGELKLPPSREYLGQEIANIADEFNRILGIVADGAQPILNRARIQELNRIVLDKLSLAEEVIPGEVRKHEVGVALYKGAPPKDCEYLLDELCRWLNSTEQFADTLHPRALVYALIKAILAHLYLAWIHPFGDGNGRTARLVEYQILISSGIPAPAAHLLSNHYNLTRTEYYKQLHQASKSGGDVVPFIQYAIQGFRDGLVSQLEPVRQQVFDVSWQDFLIDLFAHRESPTDVRRLELLQEISRIAEPVQMADLPLLSPRVAKYYANVTAKTLMRDLRKLRSMNLIVFLKGRRVRARKELIQNFLPTIAVLGEGAGKLIARVA